MCSILCWTLSICEDLGCIFCILAWFMHCQQGGELWSCFGLLDAFGRCSGGFEPFLALFVTSLTSRGDWSDRSECWPCSHVVHRSDQWWWPVWPVRAKLMQLLCFHQVVCMHSSRGSCIGSGGACICAGGALCGFSSFGLVVCALCLSIVLSRMCRVVALA
jgi:hypothetical protein